VAADHYRNLRHVVRQLRTDVPVLAVSSASVGDGKTTTAINLAGALAQAPEARVLLVDADLRRPSVAERLALAGSGRPGLTDLIASPELALADAVTTLRPFNLDVLPAGEVSPTPSDVLESVRLGELLEEARRRYRFVVLDTPPLLPVLDCRLIGQWVDGFLLVVAAHNTSQRLVAEAVTVMDPSKIVGFVFNRDDGAVSGYPAAYRASADGGGSPWWRRLLPGRKPRSSPRLSGGGVPGTSVEGPRMRNMEGSDR